MAVFVGFSSLVVYTFGIFLKPIAAEFSWSREAVSAAFGFAAMTVAVCSPALGALFDRFEPRRIIAPCLLVFGCAFASLAWLTHSLWHLYAVFIVLGAVANGTAQMAYSRAISTWFVRRRGLALAAMMCGAATGAVVMPPLAQGLVGRLGWRGAFLALGVTSLVVALPAVTFVRQRSGARVTGIGTGGDSVTDGLRSPVFWILATVLFIASIAQNGAIAHLSSLLTDRGVSARGAAFALSALGVWSIVGRLVTGWLLDRYATGRVGFAVLSFAAVGCAVLSGAHSLTAGALGAALIGFGMGGEADIVPYALGHFFGLRSFGTLYGLTWTAYAAAGVIGPVLMGKAFDATGSYQTLLLQLATATIGAGVLMLLLRDTRNTQRC